MSLTTSTFLKIQGLFRRKGWPIGVSEGYPSLYDKFIQRISLFKQEEQDLIIELTEDFLSIPLNEYLSCFHDSLKLVGEEILKGKEKIFVFPLVNFSEPTSKIKSGQGLFFLVSRHEYRMLSPNLLFSQSIDMLVDNFNNQNSCLILIDDYIGSGETAEEVCQWFLDLTMKNGKIIRENVRIVTIAAQYCGMERVKAATGVDVCSNICLKRGITDKYDEFKLPKKIELMKSIEKFLKVKPDFLFGYKRTEGLITFMDKTPNNTFPVYWLEKNNKKRPAPFPRLTSY